MYVYTQVNENPYLFIFLSLFRQETVEFFEITKEGTEKSSVMLNLFQHLNDDFYEGNARGGECEKQEA